ncbi:bifunctional riboflavin kinase/FAD synthetase [Halobacillus litoralis]|uniref:bifunctional riboflavin kinase/FAD synthetase n=1 Tax=Halobacillus litoralis TaxID=45668 RepID=UPI001CD306E7|nr:bifunctional riboflavin kinase/FAD synthetase [Halobacillus litoralis]MCA0969093.1 bifunctional riboflavin kinase/FAD synthetase [Halobacillus litoralis]
MNQSLEVEPSAVAVGFFDGVHKGHQAVIQKAKEQADYMGIRCAVMTFDPHPSVVLKKEKVNAKYITPLKEKEEILSSMGVDYLYVVTFDKELAQLSPQAFVDDFFAGLHVRHVVAGFDFSFGHKGKGTMDMLPELSRGRFSQTVIPKVEKEEDKISSTRIRGLLDEGGVQEVESLLGRPFTMKGTVVEGEKRGRTIGYPTANVNVGSDYYFPSTGVYAVSVRVEGSTYYGMANLGVKPTFEGERQPSLEVHIFDLNQDLYGMTISVQFKDKVRDEKKFSGIEALKGQLSDDEAQIRHFFSLD